MSFNRVEIIGNVGKEPEMRFTPNGNAVTSFSVAVNSKYGEKETTEWFNIVAWNKLAETCNQYITKGQQVFVDGRLQTRTWEGDDGVKHYRTELIANHVLFLGSRKQVEETEEKVEESNDFPF